VDSVHSSFADRVIVLPVEHHERNHILPYSWSYEASFTTLSVKLALEFLEKTQVFRKEERLDLRAIKEEFVAERVRNIVKYNFI